MAKSDEEEIQNYKLRELCETVNRLGKEKELKNYIISRMKGIRPQKFHRKLLDYPWDRIYTVNIDDLVENIYSNEDAPRLLVQNQNKKKVDNRAQVELFKLHGCVNEPNEPLVFSRSEYNDLISGQLHYRLNDLVVDLQNRSFIFVGASLDEPDIDNYLSIYEKAGYPKGLGKVIFIDPYPNYAMKQRAEGMGGKIIKCTTEDFLNFVSSIKYNPESIEASIKRMEYRSGIYRYKDIMSSLEKGVYESRLYQGYLCDWKDIRDGWVFKNNIVSAILAEVKKFEKIKSSVFCLAIYGKRFTGKDCTLKFLAPLLTKENYDVLIYNGKQFDYNCLIDYINVSVNSKFALLISNASFLYKELEKLYSLSIETKKIIVITTSREYYHNRKKYYLEEHPYTEICIQNTINRGMAKVIYEKLIEKGSSGWLSRNPHIGYKQIQNKNTIINLFFSLSYGEGFKRRLHKDILKIKKDDKLLNLYQELALFNVADLEYYPKELLTNRYDLFAKKEENNRINIDFISIGSNGLTLKNDLLVDTIWRETDKAKKEEIIIEILRLISPYVDEKRNTYWRIVFESIAKFDILSNRIHLGKKQIIEMYYKMKDYYGDISYYWLQLGLAEQSINEFSSAQIHLDMAAEIRPNAYQIQHAIARNYLRHAIICDDADEALLFYNEGKERLLSLINSKDYNKVKAREFSIHCYINESISFYEKYGIKVTRNMAISMQKLIKQLHETDPYYKPLSKRFVSFLNRNNAIQFITFKPGDALFSEIVGTDNTASLTEDIIIESI